jgi:hypothetical protein
MTLRTDRTSKPKPLLSTPDLRRMPAARYGQDCSGWCYSRHSDEPAHLEISERELAKQNYSSFGRLMLSVPTPATTRILVAKEHNRQRITVPIVCYSMLAVSLIAAHFALSCFFWRGVIVQMFKLMSLFTAAALVVSTAICYSADAEHGRDLAARWCASCHLVSPGQQRSSSDVPPFATIARSPNFDPRRLAYFLLDPHPKMQDLPLSRAAADDLAAYIATLKH